MTKKKEKADNDPLVVFSKEIGVKAAYMKTRTIEDCLNCGKPKCNGCPTAEPEYLAKYMSGATRLARS